MKQLALRIKYWILGYMAYLVQKYGKITVDVIQKDVVSRRVYVKKGKIRYWKHFYNGVVTTQKW